MQIKIYFSPDIALSKQFVKTQMKCCVPPKYLYWGFQYTKGKMSLIVVTFSIFVFRHTSDSL